MLRFLDIVFVGFHSVLIIFNLFGWLWKPSRLVNLVTLSLTGASWFILGIFYGIGYCPLTEWHWRILEKLGQGPLPDSYISYLIHRLFHLIPPSPAIVNAATFICFAIALSFSLFFNMRDRKIRIPFINYFK